jgi:hypothetical protein
LIGRSMTRVGNSGLIKVALILATAGGRRAIPIGTNRNSTK